MKISKIANFFAILAMAVVLAGCSTDESKTLEGQDITDLGSVDIPGKSVVLHGYMINRPRYANQYVYVVEKGPSRALIRVTQVYEVHNLGAKKLPGQNLFIRGYRLVRDGLTTKDHFVYFLEDAQGNFISGAPASYDAFRYIEGISGVVSPDVTAPIHVQ